MEKDKDRDLQPITGESEISLPPEKSIKLTQNELLDLTGLSEDEVAELKRQHAAGMIDVNKKAKELKIDVMALDAALSSFTDQTAKATQAGASVTITHTQSTSIGRTEVVVGNTEKAAQGKISSSAAGLEDRTLWIAGIIAVVVIIIALIVFRS